MKRIRRADDFAVPIDSTVSAKGKITLNSIMCAYLDVMHRIIIQRSAVDVFLRGQGEAKRLAIVANNEFPSANERN